MEGRDLKKKKESTNVGGIRLLRLFHHRLWQLNRMLKHLFVVKRLSRLGCVDLVLCFRWGTL